MNIQQAVDLILSAPERLAYIVDGIIARHPDLAELDDELDDLVARGLYGEGE